jgi:hypothetical protein
MESAELDTIPTEAALMEVEVEVAHLKTTEMETAVEHGRIYPSAVF